MKKPIVVLFLFICYASEAQKNMDGLVDAEKSFAAHSVKHGAKEAFLKYLDSNGIVFEQGKAVNGIEVWKKRENRPTVLDWLPQFAEISLSGDFGYTTGPWELKAGAANDSILARGQYTTVWHVNKNGEWKFLVDLGVGNRQRNQDSELIKINATKVHGPAETNKITEAEEKFIEEFKKDKTSAYKTYLSEKSILNRNGFDYSATNSKSQLDQITNTPSGIQFTVSGTSIAASGDLAYVYGDTREGNKSENYLRIWRKEKNGWKIALEVLRY